MKDLFDEIDEERQDLPKLKKISKEVQKKRNYNFYQQLAVCLFIFLFIAGVIRAIRYVPTAEKGVVSSMNDVLGLE